MTESDFWEHLEYRVTREMAGSERCRKRGLWCDGFVPHQYEFDDGPPRITGHTWVGLGSGTDQQSWHFTLRLPSAALDRKAVDWASLLPAEDVTDWLALDIDAGRMEIDPAAATPDPPVEGT